MNQRLLKCTIGLEYRRDRGSGCALFFTQSSMLCACARLTLLLRLKTALGCEHSCSWVHDAPTQNSGPFPLLVSCLSSIATKHTNCPKMLCNNGIMLLCIMSIWGHRFVSPDFNTKSFAFHTIVVNSSTNSAHSSNCAAAFSNRSALASSFSRCRALLE